MAESQDHQEPLGKQSHAASDQSGAASGKILQLFRSELVVISLGLSSFAENLYEQETRVVHLDWRPPARGDKELADILKSLGR